MNEQQDEEIETTMVCGKTLYKRPCSVCGEMIWSQWKTEYVRCDECGYGKSKDFGCDTGGGIRINHKGTPES